jgi:GNAT superfamily N-acetyltransferase
VSLLHMATSGDFIDAELSYRLESGEWLPSLAFVDALQREQPELGAEREMVGGGWMLYGGPGSPVNHIIGMGLQGPVSAEEMDRVEDFYRSRHSVCEVVVSPYADMSLMHELGKRGYRVTEWNSVLTRRTVAGERFDSHGVEVERVKAHQAALWSEVVAGGWADIVAVRAEIFVPLALAPNAICFLAILDGKPAGGAGGSTFPESGIAPFYGAATLPEYRNRGVQNALFQARLGAAAEAGCDLAMVCTQPGTVSQRNAERNGFRVAYTKVAMQRSFQAKGDGRSPLD